MSSGRGCVLGPFVFIKLTVCCVLRALRPRYAPLAVKRGLRYLSALVAGVLISSTLVTLLLQGHLPPPATLPPAPRRLSGIGLRVVEDPSPGREWLYAGVLSAARYVRTRAHTAYSTWGKGVPSLDVFTGDVSREATPRQLSVVALPGTVYLKMLYNVLTLLN